MDNLLLELYHLVDAAETWQICGVFVIAMGVLWAIMLYKT